MKKTPSLSVFSKYTVSVTNPVLVTTKRYDAVLPGRAILSPGVDVSCKPNGGPGVGVAVAVPLGVTVGVVVPVGGVTLGVEVFVALITVEVTVCAGEVCDGDGVAMETGELFEGPGVFVVTVPRVAIVLVIVGVSASKEGVAIVDKTTKAKVDDTTAMKLGDCIRFIRSF